MIEPFVCPECGESVSALDPGCNACDAAQPLGGWPLHPFVGAVLGDRYRVGEKLGQGGAGQVYTAHDVRFGEAETQVVVKLFTAPHLAGMMRRFENEVRATRRLSGARFVRIYDAGQHNGTPYLVMERVRGKTLRAWLAEVNRASSEQTALYVSEIATALREAHQNGITHRDIKPENIMLLDEAPPLLKLLDFGIAHLADLDVTSSQVGTPRYMAPEQFQGRDVDARTDIYALGIILYELLTGQAPFVGTTFESIVHAKLHERAPELPRGLGQPALRALCRDMLAQDPQKRPQNMDQVLVRIRLGAPVARPWLMRSALLAGAAGLTGAGAFGLSHHADRPTTRAGHGVGSYVYDAHDGVSSVSVGAASAPSASSTVRASPAPKSPASVAGDTHRPAALASSSSQRFPASSNAPAIPRSGVLHPGDL